MEASTSHTQPSCAGSDTHPVGIEVARHIVQCLYRNESVPVIRQRLALPTGNKQARKRLLVIAQTAAFGQAWVQSVPPAIAPAVDAIWIEWTRQRGDDRERMRRLQRLFRAVDRIRVCVQWG